MTPDPLYLKHRPPWLEYRECKRCKGTGKCPDCQGTGVGTHGLGSCYECDKPGLCALCDGTGDMHLRKLWRPTGYLRRRWRYNRRMLGVQRPGRGRARWPLRLWDRFRDDDIMPYPRPDHNIYQRHLPKWAKVSKRHQIYEVLLDVPRLQTFASRWRRSGGLYGSMYNPLEPRRRPRW